MKWRQVLEYDSPELVEQVYSTLEKIKGIKIIISRPFSEKDLIEQMRPIIKPIPVEPTPIVTKDINPNSQRQMILDFFKKNYPRIIHNPDLEKFAKENGWSINGTMTEVSKLRIYGVENIGKNRGWKFTPSSNMPSH
jgi:hypothetical protein